VKASLAQIGGNQRCDILVLKELTMTDIILGLGVATFIVYTGFHISYLLSLKRTSERMGVFLENTEGT
jgi:hypothetical protein